MKHISTIITAIAVSLIAISCTKQGNPSADPAKEGYVDATSKTTWTYFSLSKGEVIGTGAESEADNAAWAARTDWDLAVCRYNIRTNSGTSSSTGATMSGVICNIQWNGRRKDSFGIKRDRNHIQDKCRRLESDASRIFEGSGICVPYRRRRKRI